MSVRLALLRLFWTPQLIRNVTTMHLKSHQAIWFSVFIRVFFRSQYIVNTLRHWVTSIIGFSHDNLLLMLPVGVIIFWSNNSMQVGYSSVVKDTDHQELDVSIIFRYWWRDNYLDTKWFLSLYSAMITLCHGHKWISFSEKWFLWIIIGCLYMG